MSKVEKLSKAIKIDGNIRGMSDVNEIKSAIDSYHLSQGDRFSIEIVSSFAMPSALIGYLLKVAQQDQVALSLKIHDTGLVELLEDLNLQEVLILKFRINNKLQF